MADEWTEDDEIVDEEAVEADEGPSRGLLVVRAGALLVVWVVIGAALLIVLWLLVAIVIGIIGAI